MKTAPTPSWPAYTEEEAEAVQRVLLSNKVNYWTGGEAREFEREFASWAGVDYAVALANGTLALELALRAVGVGPGDDVIVTPRTFLASVSCVVNVGARPVFAEVDPDSGNISARTIEPALTPRTKAIVCVHLAGWPCDMDPIMSLARDRSIAVVEDCAQAHGALYKGRPVGGIGHVGAWSFCQDKIVTTGGEGGMVTTNDKLLWERMWSYKDHGKSYRAVYVDSHTTGFKWLHEGFGSNFRITEIQAVIGRIQLKRIADWSQKRRANALALLKALEPFSGPRAPIRIPQLECNGCSGTCITACSRDRTDRCQHAYYRLYAYVQPENLGSGWSRDEIIERISGLGVPCFQGSCSEVYLEKAFDGTDFRPRDRLPIAKELGETSIAFLVHPTIGQAEIRRWMNVIESVLCESRKDL